MVPKKLLWSLTFVDKISLSLHNINRPVQVISVCKSENCLERLPYRLRLCNKYFYISVQSSVNHRIILEYGMSEKKKSGILDRILEYTPSVIFITIDP